MDNRLVLTVLFVTLAGTFMGTYAQTTTTAAPSSNTTAAASSNTTAAPSSNTTAAPSSNTTAAASSNTTAAPSSNTTAAPSSNTTAAPSSNMTTRPSSNMTTGPSSNMTARPSSNMTAAPSTNTSSAPTNVTSAPSTNTSSAPTNVTSAPSTNTSSAPTNVTSAPATNMTTATVTTAAPLIPNYNVTNLTAAISRQGCGVTQLCAAEPSQCDPSTGGTCFFLGAQQISGQNFKFQLSGESEGYIAATLSTSTKPGGGDNTYICANNNGVVKFFGALFNNSKLTITTLNANNVSGSVNGKKIQCAFDATVPDSNSTSRATRAGTSYSLSVSTGSYNATSNGLGTPTFRITTNVVDLANVSANITNGLSSNSTAAPTTAHAVTIQQSLMQALLITVGVLSLTMF